MASSLLRHRLRHVAGGRRGVDTALRQVSADVVVPSIATMGVRDTPAPRPRPGPHLRRSPRLLLAAHASPGCPHFTWMPLPLYLAAHAPGSAWLSERPVSLFDQPASVSHSGPLLEPGRGPAESRTRDPPITLWDHVTDMPLAAPAFSPHPTVAKGHRRPGSASHTWPHVQSEESSPGPPGQGLAPTKAIDPQSRSPRVLAGQWEPHSAAGIRPQAPGQIRLS